LAAGHPLRVPVVEDPAAAVAHYEPWVGFRGLDTLISADAVRGQMHPIVMVVVAAAAAALHHWAGCKANRVLVDVLHEVPRRDKEPCTAMVVSVHHDA
jgi:hypothetical protein